MSKSVELRRLCHRYGANVHALRDVSICVAPSEFVTLLGPSGSGKSTVLKLLAGFETPTGGDVLIDGRSVLAVPPHKRGIGMVFQNYALFPHMNVVENIAFPLRARGLPEAETKRRVSDVLGVARLEAFAARYPRELSGGQQQRVALARAIVFDPEVLLMDEPLGALDRNLREQLKLEIKRIQQEFKMTVLFVTHDQDEALVLSDRIVVMREGSVEQVATPREMYAKPRNRFVAEFLGESNLLPCRRGADPLHPADAASPRRSAEGRDCWIMIRPESIELSTQELPGALTGKLRDVFFLGDATRYIVDVGGASVVVKSQNKNQPVPAPGQTVSLLWDETSAFVLED
jgi:putative spermidine/putrescine transport system ATP-binding protein